MSYDENTVPRKFDDADSKVSVDADSIRWTYREYFDLPQDRLYMLYWRNPLGTIYLHVMDAHDTEIASDSYSDCEVWMLTEDNKAIASLAWTPDDDENLLTILGAVTLSPVYRRILQTTLERTPQFKSLKRLLTPCWNKPDGAYIYRHLPYYLQKEQAQEASASAD
jgi:hypothetical protein